jgi:hypothetical protein
MSYSSGSGWTIEGHKWSSFSRAECIKWCTPSNSQALCTRDSLERVSYWWRLRLCDRQPLIAQLVCLSSKIRTFFQCNATEHILLHVATLETFPGSRKLFRENRRKVSIPLKLA